MIVVILLLCFIFAAFFSGLETGLVAADQFLLFAKKEKGIKYAEAAVFLLLNPERLLSTTLIGTNISVVTASVLLNSTLRNAGMGWFSGISSVFLSIALLIFAEIIPKSFFRIKTDGLSVRLAPVLVFFYYIFIPIAFVLNTIVKIILLLSGRHGSSKKKLDSRQDLKLIVRLGSREAGIPVRDRRIIEDIFDFQETIAREVMIQLHTSPACSVDDTIQTAVRYSSAYGMEFIPVYRGRADNIIGYINIEDIFNRLSDGQGTGFRSKGSRHGEDSGYTLPAVPASSPGLDTKTRIGDLVRKPEYYPDTKNIPDLLLEMNKERLELVFIVNEYGRVTGMLTPEEIVSEIIGFKPGGGRSHDELIQKTGDNTYEANSISDIEDFQNKTGIHLKNKGVDTLGGYLCMAMGRIPRPGEEYTEKNVVFKVKKGTELRTELIEIRIRQ